MACIVSKFPTNRIEFIDIDQEIMRVEEKLEKIESYLSLDEIEVKIEINENACFNENMIHALCEPYGTKQHKTPLLTISIIKPNTEAKERIAILFNSTDKFLGIAVKIESMDDIRIIERMINEKYPTELLSLEFFKNFLDNCFQRKYYPKLNNQERVAYYVRDFDRDGRIDNMTIPKAIQLLEEIKAHYEFMKVQLYVDDLLGKLYSMRGDYKKALAIYAGKLKMGITNTHWGNDILKAKYKGQIDVDAMELFSISRKNTKFVVDKLPELYAEANDILKEYKKRHSQDFLQYIGNKYKSRLEKGGWWSFYALTEFLHFCKNLSRQAENRLRARAGIKELEIEIKPDSYYRQIPWYYR